MNQTLSNLYYEMCQTHDRLAVQYFSTLSKIAKTCSNAAILGLQSLNSTIAILKGFKDSQAPARSLLAIDPRPADRGKIQNIQALASQSGIDFRFRQISDLDTTIEQPVDL